MRRDKISSLPVELEKVLFANPVISALLKGWHQIDLPDSWLVAGIIVQTYWNSAHGFDLLNGVSDADIVYFDKEDLTEKSEIYNEKRIIELFHDLPIKFDVKNEARVHLWYEKQFGFPIEAYNSTEAAIDTFPTTAGSIGIRPSGGGIECYASFGLDDLLNLVVRANKRQITQDIYQKKVNRWRIHWPNISIINW